MAKPPETLGDHALSDAERRRMDMYMRIANELGGAEGLCRTCAFRSGTQANNSAETLALIEHNCIIMGARFNCHAGMEMDPFTARIEDDVRSPRGECAGFTALRRGVFSKKPVSSPLSGDTP